MMWAGVKSTKFKEAFNVFRVFGFLMIGDYLNYKYYYGKTEWYLRKYAFQIQNDLLRTEEDVKRERDQ